jgi:hypothetical protein
VIQLDEEQVIAVRELDPKVHLALQHYELLPQRSKFSASSWLLDLKSEAPRLKRTIISAAMVADVKRFCHQSELTRFSVHITAS